MDRAIGLLCVSVALGAGGACSLFVDTGGLDTETDDDAGDGMPNDALVDTFVLDASDASDTATETSSPDAEGGCPTGQGPTMVPIPGGYCIDSTEVTRAQYAVFLATAPTTSGQPAECSWNTSFTPVPWDPSLTTYPVIGVDWCDAYAYCKWAGKRMCGAIDGGSYPYSSQNDPNASQWYRACSANGSRTYPYGNAFVAGACNAPTGDASIAPVASFPQCVGGYPGLYDMAGNIEEWQDSCNAQTGANDACHDQSGTFGYANGDPVGSTRCDFDDDDTRSNHLADVGIRCCYP